MNSINLSVLKKLELKLKKKSVLKMYNVKLLLLFYYNYM